ncbi:hypothetical protein SCHPADRAFT_1001187 [Schizopora paradoxa]|uniref:Uncharacterized protein n=1 Tax=Schizopora paradoxa TaxID=27342 RepID=A0A0H2R8B6_9AGAM|nr:hypothetical protein SCHPADRAFT_1001187 [Schizopora paradoxa]
MASAREDVSAAVSNWFDREVAYPVELEKELESLDWLLQDSYHSNLRGDPGLRNRVKGISVRFQRISAILNNLTTALNKKNDIFGRFARMCGIDLLPDEVLAAIFEMVVNVTGSTHEEFAVPCKWKAAVRLSHINHRPC